MIRTAAALALVLLLTGCSGETDGTASLDAYAVVEPDVLRVSGVHGACDRLLEPEVQQDADAVRITVPLRVESGSCEDLGVLLVEQVQLDAPLGDRRVLSGTRPLDRRCTVDRDTTSPYAGTPEADLPAEGVRVVCRDGVELPVDSDLRPDRLDVTVDDGHVSGVRR